MKINDIFVYETKGYLSVNRIVDMSYVNFKYDHIGITISTKEIDKGCRLDTQVNYEQASNIVKIDKKIETYEEFENFFYKYIENYIAFQ